MRQCDAPSLSSPSSIFVRHPDVASALRSLPALERSPYRHAPVTAFEWTMLLAVIAWVVAATFVRWPAPLSSQFGSNSTIDAASRFAYPLAMLTPRYADSSLVAEFVDDLRASAPPFIVDATRGVPKSDALVPSLGSWNPRWRYPTSGVAWWTMTPALRAFYDYVASNYAVVDVVGPQRWVIYARRTGPEMR